MNQQKHQMILEKTFSSGEEEWACPTCGRRILVNWEPKFKRTVLDVGDDYATHSGGKGGLVMGAKQVAPTNAALLQEHSEEPIPDMRLAPWIAWLDEVGFEDLWNDEAQ